MALLLRLATWLLFPLIAATSASAMVLVRPPAQLQGGANDVAIVQGIAYVATFAGVELFDVSHPKDGSASLGILPGTARAVAVDGTRAAVLGTAEVHILDISNPRNPFEIGAFPAPAQACDIDVEGNLVFVAERLLVLRIFDISDPANPVEVGALSLVPYTYAYGDSAITVVDGIAYLNSSGGAAIIDVHDPAHPALLSRVPSSAANAFGDTTVAVRNGRLYVPDVDYTDPAGRSGIRILDVSNPAAAVPVGFVEITPVLDIAFAGDLLFALDGYGLWSFDISDPSHPLPLGNISFGQPPGGAAWSMAAVEVVNGYAHMAGIDKSLGTVDLSRPEFARRSAGEGNYYTVEPAGGLLYALGYGRFDVLEVIPPLAPVQIGSTSTTAYDPRDLEIVGNVAYAGGYFTGIHIIDIADPTHPSEAGSAPYGAWALAHSQDRLYAVDRLAGVSILDISDPVHPAPLGSIDLFDELAYASDLDLAGHLLYVTGYYGVRVVDVSDASAPRVIGRFDGDPRLFPNSSVLAGDVLYLSYGDLGGIRLIDVSDPTHPFEIGSLFGTEVPGAVDLEVEGPRLYVSDGMVRVLDISNPRAPALLGGAEGAWRISVADGIVYSAFNYDFRGIEFGPEYAPPLEVEIDVAPGDPRNRVLVTKPGAVLVGLHGSAYFDVRDVDRRSLAFGPDGAHALLAVRLPLNRDRHPDLAAFFWVPDAGIALGDKEVCLSGQTKDGRAFRGCDAIQPVIGCGRGFVGALLVPLCLPLLRAARRSRRR